MLELVMKTYAYDHISGSGGSITPVIMIWAIYVGVVLASAAAIYNKKFVGGIIRRIIKNGAVGEENAKTADELGIKGKLERRVLLKNVTVGKILVLKNKESFPVKRYTGFIGGLKKFFSLDGREKREVNLKTAEYYIPESIRAKAEIRFDDKGIRPAVLIILFILLTAAFYLATLALPELLQFLDNAIGYMKDL